MVDVYTIAYVTLQKFTYQKELKSGKCITYTYKRIRTHLPLMNYKVYRVVNSTSNLLLKSLQSEKANMLKFWVKLKLQKLETSFTNWKRKPSLAENVSQN